jgi:hypothetical protein
MHSHIKGEQCLLQRNAHRIAVKPLVCSELPEEFVVQGVEVMELKTQVFSCIGLLMITYKLECFFFWRCSPGLKFVILSLTPRVREQTWL